jgi:hypothetical protein
MSTKLVALLSRLLRPLLLVAYVIFAAGKVAPKQRTSAKTPSSPAFSPTIPKTWDDQAMATLEVPLANPIGSPKHVAADYYYRIPVRPIYRSYPSTPRAMSHPATWMG